MRFLVLEGLDGSGKSTQVGLLRNYLEAQGVKHKYLHFPRLEQGIYGSLIARFLRGEMGSNENVDPYLVALMFAGDRMDAKGIIQDWIDQGFFVLVDRFVYSNIAFQCAKLSDRHEQVKLAEWIMELEYKYNNLPVPDLNIFLDVPFHFTRERLTVNREGEDRAYLKGQQDIHEQDLEFQQKVSEIYHSVCSAHGNLEIINCADDSGRMKLPDAIFEDIKGLIHFEKTS